MTVNPNLVGEVSRAMRNRAIELAIAMDQEMFAIDSFQISNSTTSIGLDWHRLKQSLNLPIDETLSDLNLSEECKIWIQEGAPTRQLSISILFQSNFLPSDSYSTQSFH